LYLFSPWQGTDGATDVDVKLLSHSNEVDDVLALGSDLNFEPQALTISNSRG
jgi:hypothetical protein